MVCPPDLRTSYAEFLMQAISTAPLSFVYADFEEMPLNYSGTKRDAYLASLERLAGCSTALAKYTAFVKREITPGDVKAPRVITAHNRSANLLFYPVAHGFERSLLSIVDADSDHLGLPFFAKGLNFDDRSVHIRQKMSDGYSCLCIDVSSFDNCIREGFFEGELDFFERLAPGIDFSIFREAYIDRSPDDYLQTDVVCHLPPCRKSGDLQTGSGNCAVMLFLCSHLRAFVPQARFYCDGDDTLIFVPHAAVSRAKRQLRIVASSYGLDVRVDKTCSTINDIDFCQHRMSDVGLVPNPVRVYVKLATAVVSRDTPENRLTAALSKHEAVAQYLQVFPDMPLLRCLPVPRRSVTRSDRYYDSMRYPNWVTIFPEVHFDEIETTISLSVHGSDG